MAREPSIKSPEFLLRIRNVSRGKQNIGNNNADNNKGIFSGKMIHLSLSLGVRIPARRYPVCFIKKRSKYYAK